MAKKLQNPDTGRLPGIVRTLSVALHPVTIDITSGSYFFRDTNIEKIHELLDKHGLDYHKDNEFVWFYDLIDQRWSFITCLPVATFPQTSTGYNPTSYRASYRTVYAGVESPPVYSFGPSTNTQELAKLLMMSTISLSAFLVFLYQYGTSLWMDKAISFLLEGDFSNKKPAQTSNEVFWKVMKEVVCSLGVADEIRYKALLLLDKLGLLEKYLPELCKNKNVFQNPEHHIDDVFNHLLQSTKFWEAVKALELSNELHKEIYDPAYHNFSAVMLASLLHDVGKADTMTIDDT